MPRERLNGLTCLTVAAKVGVQWSDHLSDSGNTKGNTKSFTQVESLVLPPPVVIPNSAG